LAGINRALCHRDKAVAIETGELSPGKSLVLGVPGLCALIAAGRLFVSGATGVAANLGVDAFVIGVVLAAIGTSLPELVTVFLSPLRGHDEVGVGTLIGSNLFNGLFIVGVAGMIHPIDAPPGEVALTLAAGLVALLLLLPNRNGLIGRGRGVGLLLVYAGFIWVTISCFQRSSGWVTQRLEFAERRRSSIQQPISETLGNGGCGRGLVGEQWSRTAAQLSYLPLEHRMDEGPGWVGTARSPESLCSHSGTARNRKGLTGASFWSFRTARTYAYAAASATRRARTAAASLSSTATLSSHPRQASVMLWP
jgi:hypothetical protein